MSKLRKILLGIIVVGLIVAGFQITLRVVAEQRNTVVEIVADLDSFISLGKKMNKNEVELLKELRMAGVNSIAVSEATIQQLSEAGKIQVYENAHIKNNSWPEAQSFFSSINKYIDTNGIEYTDLTLITTDDINLFDFLKKSLENRYNGKTTTFEVDGKYGVLIDYPITSINTVSLGIMEEDLAKASK